MKVGVSNCPRSKPILSQFSFPTANLLPTVLPYLPPNKWKPPLQITTQDSSQYHTLHSSHFSSMASLSLPKHTFTSLLPTQTPRHYYPSSQIVSKSSNSQFYGLKLSNSTSLPIPSSSSGKNIICGKVDKGKVPPNFNLKDQDGKSVSLSKFKGKPVVVYFYPADETPGCTKQACAFRDSYEKFKKAGAQVVGISGDDSASHKAFAKKYKLPFTLLSDEGNKVRKEWGVPSDLFGTLPGRQTYVLDKNGVVQLIYNNQFQPEKHIDETLKLLQSL